MSDMHHIEALIAGQGRESKAHWEGMRREIGARFDAIDSRLAAIDEKQRIANGRATTMEKALERMDERVGQLQRDGNEQEQRLDDIDRRVHAHKRASDRPASPAVLHRRADDEQAITRRDVYVGLGCSMLTVGVLLWILDVMGKL